MLEEDKPLCLCAGCKGALLMDVTPTEMFSTKEGTTGTEENENGEMEKT